MRDPDDDDDYPPREDRLFGGSGGFRRKLSDSISGLLDPEGAFGKGKDLVTGVTQATKTEVVRMVSAEVRNFLDGMDTVDLMQRVIAGLVIDVKAEIRFSIDPNGQLKSSLTTKGTDIRSAEDGKKGEAPRAEAKGETGRGETGRSEAGRAEAGRGDAGRGDAGRGDAGRSEAAKAEAARTEAARAEAARAEAARSDGSRGEAVRPRVEPKPEPRKPDGKP